ncbi:MAG: 30S ribosomal protein S18 [Candidatus Nomurabacteria bacterium]|jgi:small subunit ribosomal protein S18|nr:30S ribosomal protein S18 [Candidatus Nomurabacteria bacterium]
MKKFKVSPKTIFDYRNPKQLSRYVDAFGRIEPMGKNGLSARQQRQLAVAIKRARHLGLLAFVAEG